MHSVNRSSSGPIILQVTAILGVAPLVVGLVTVALLGPQALVGPAGGPAKSFPPGWILIIPAGRNYSHDPGGGIYGGPYNLTTATSFSGTFVATGGSGISLFLMNYSDWNWSGHWSPPTYNPQHAILSVVNALLGDFRVPLAAGTYYFVMENGGRESCDVGWSAPLAFFPAQ